VGIEAQFDTPQQCREEGPCKSFELLAEITGLVGTATMLFFCRGIVFFNLQSNP